MSFINKLMFWKKEDDFPFETPSFDTNSTPFDQPFTPDQQPQLSQPFSTQPTNQPEFELGLNAQSPFPEFEPEPQQTAQPQSFSNPFDQSQKQQANPFQSSSFNQPYASTQSQPSYSEPQHSYQQQYTTSDTQLYHKDIEVISSKLDAIKAMIESLNQRMANLEQVQHDQNQKRYNW